MLKETAKASHHLLIRVSHPKHQLPLLETTGQLQKESRVQGGRHKSSNLISGKEKIFIVGDSLIRNLNGWTMSTRKAVKIHSFSGSTVQELDLFIKPILARKPHHVILLIGTNDIPDKNVTAETIADKIMEIGKKLKTMLSDVLFLNLLQEVM